MRKELQGPYFCLFNLHFTPSGTISDKSFHSGYIHRNMNIHSKCYVSSFSSFGSALICQQAPFHSFREWFLKNTFLAFTYIVLGNYIPNFTFLASVVLDLRWYVPSPPNSPLQGVISEKSFLSGYIHRNRNLQPNFTFLTAVVSVEDSVLYSFIPHFICEKSFLSGHCNKLVTYIQNFSFLASVVLALRWYVSQSVSPLYILDKLNVIVPIFNNIWLRTALSCQW